MLTPGIIIMWGIRGVCTLALTVAKTSSDLSMTNCIKPNDFTPNGIKPKDHLPRPALLVQERPCKPSRLTLLPQWHICATQMLAPRRKPNEIRIC